MLREVEAAAQHAIFASNTSTIPIRDIAAASAHPERVLGMHFFSPVHKMPLLEVIVTPDTSAETTATVVAYGRTLGKTVIVVRDGPGFYVNRILAPYLNTAYANFTGTSQATPFVTAVVRRLSGVRPRPSSSHCMRNARPDSVNSKLMRM